MALKNNESKRKLSMRMHRRKLYRKDKKKITSILHLDKKITLAAEEETGLTLIKTSKLKFNLEWEEKT